MIMNINTKSNQTKYFALDQHENNPSISPCLGQVVVAEDVPHLPSSIGYPPLFLIFLLPER